MIWQVLNYQFCSFKSKIAKENTFCRYAMIQVPCINVNPAPLVAPVPPNPLDAAVLTGSNNLHVGIEACTAAAVVVQLLVSPYTARRYSGE